MAVQLFQGLAPSYDVTVDWATFFQDRYWKCWVAKRVPDGPGRLGLDIGCGTLLMEERLRSREARFVGLDITQEMLRAGQAKSLPNVPLLMRGDAENLPFPDESFDFVLSCYVIKYVRTARFADELARVTKPGGAAVIYDFAKPKGILAPFLELYIQAGLRAVGALLACLGKNSAFAFERLPDIVGRAVWDEEIVGAMQERGFETIAAERLTGGTVFAYCGRKRGSPYSRHLR